MVSGDGLPFHAPVAGRVVVGPVEAVESALGESRHLHERQEPRGEFSQRGFAHGEFASVVEASVGPVLETRQAGVIEDAGASVVAAEASGALGAFADFLAVVDEQGAARRGVLGHEDGAGDFPPHSAPVGAGRHAGLVVVFDVADAAREGGGVRAVVAVEIVGPDAAFVEGAEGVVGGAVVDGVEAGGEERVGHAAFGEFHVVVVAFRHEEDSAIAQAGVGDDPLPEGHGHHVRHVAAEAADAAVLPVGDDVVHEPPSARDGRAGGEDARQRSGGVRAVAVVAAVVELDGFVPVVLGGRPGGGVVASDAAVAALGFEFAARKHEGAVASLRLQVVEGVVAREEAASVVLRAKAFVRADDGLIAARDVVGDEVHHGHHAPAAAARDEGVELREAVLRVGGEVGIHVVVVGHGVGASGDAFHGAGGVCREAGVLGLGGVAQDASEPQMGDAEARDGFQRGVVHAVEGAAAVLLAGSPRDASEGEVRKVADEELIDDRSHERWGF